MISVRASASPHDLVLLGCRRRLLTRRQSVSRCSYPVVSHAMAVEPIACTQVWKCSDHCFLPVVPLFDLASCSKYKVYQKSMQLAPPCARIRELQSCRTSMWSLLQEVARLNITCTSYKWTMMVMDSISEFEIVM